MVRLQLFTDGACRGNPGEAAIGMVLKDDNGKTLARRHRYLGRTTNNVAEYRGLIDGLQLAGEFTPTQLDIYMDSNLVVEQINGRWRVKDENLLILWLEAQKLMAGMANVHVRYVPREKNAEADALANTALDERLKRGATVTER